LNDDYGLECEYPFCDCEARFYEGADEIMELPELFDMAEYDFGEDEEEE
jgi:hypothetical protein